MAAGDLREPHEKLLGRVLSADESERKPVLVVPNGDPILFNNAEYDKGVSVLKEKFQWEVSSVGGVTLGCSSPPLTQSHLPVPPRGHPRGETRAAPSYRVGRGDRGAGGEGRGSRGPMRDSVRPMGSLAKEFQCLVDRKINRGIGSEVLRRPC